MAETHQRKTQLEFRLGEFYRESSLDGMNERDPNGRPEVLSDERMMVWRPPYQYEFTVYEKTVYGVRSKNHDADDAFYRCVRIQQIDTETGKIVYDHTVSDESRGSEDD